MVLWVDVRKSVLNEQEHKRDEQKAHPVADAARLARLRAVAHLRHPHLVEMRAVIGKSDRFEAEPRGQVSVAELCRLRFGGGPVPLRFGLRILLDALSGLAALHGSSFAHGEFAPFNVYVARDGTAQLLPLVAAHWDGDVPNADAAGYAAPERLRGDPFDSRADVFSAGVMLWEMITGRSFRGLPPDIIAAWVVDGKVPDPVHPDDAPWVVDLAAVAVQALQVNPSARPTNVGIMGADIENFAAGHVASSKDVAELLRDGPLPSVRGAAAASEPPADAWTPSISPTAVSISPTLEIAPAVAVGAPLIPPPPLAPTWSTPPPSSAISRDPAPPSRSPRPKKRGQSVIAWSTLGMALVLLGIATRELFTVGPASKAFPAAAATSDSLAIKAPPPAEPARPESTFSPAPPPPASSDKVVPASSKPANVPPPNAVVPPRIVVPSVAARPSRVEPQPKPQVPARAPSRRAPSETSGRKAGQATENPFGI